MNSRAAMFAQAARGPVLLITIGILFALQQEGVISFGRTWPALIIVIGVMKLIERLVLGPGPQAAPQFGPYGQAQYGQAQYGQPGYGAPGGPRPQAPIQGPYAQKVPPTYRPAGTYAAPAGATPPASSSADPVIPPPGEGGRT